VTDPTTARGDYTPPSSETIRLRQNEDRALRSLLAQRILYSRAKRWQWTSWTLVLVVGLAAPFIAALFRSASVAVGATAGVLLFLGRTVVAWRVSQLASQAAATQEVFDQYVFEMPRSLERPTLPSEHDIARIVGATSELGTKITQEKLRDWYAVNDSASGAVSVAAAQHTNASYSDSLIRSTVVVWAVLAVLWCIVLAVIAVVVGFSWGTFLLGVVLPVLPAALSVTEFILSLRKDARERAALAKAIEARIDDSPSTPITGQKLLVWQNELYELRRSRPQVPNWLYRLRRTKNEAAAAEVVDQLYRRVEGNR
jgi:fatty acid desaturase